MLCWPPLRRVHVRVDDSVLFKSRLVIVVIVVERMHAIKFRFDFAQFPLRIYFELFQGPEVVQCIRFKLHVRVDDRTVRGGRVDGLLGGAFLSFFNSQTIPDHMDKKLSRLFGNHAITAIGNDLGCPKTQNLRLRRHLVTETATSTRP